VVSQRDLQACNAAEVQPEGASPPPRRSLLAQLRQWGVAGVTAYGLLNTVYYLGAMAVFWVCVAKVTLGMGWQACLRQVSYVFGLTWALSQLTKIPRLLGYNILNEARTALPLPLDTSTLQGPPAGAACGPRP